MDIFVEISMLLAFSAGVAMIMRLLRQPLIIGYILTGILVGPSVLGWVGSSSDIEVLGRFGVALLLFIVGLSLNPKEVKQVGKVALFAGIGQILLTSVAGYGICQAFGFDTMTSIYIAIALTFSSTIIVLKLLTDKKEQTKLYGKISMGLLLVQDIVAAFALLAASAMSSGGGLSYDQLGQLVVKGLALFVGVVIVSVVVIKRMNTFLARSQELLFLFALAWGLGIAALAYQMGLSVEIGALMAGVALASMPYAHEVGARLRPLRDFFIVVFFIALGAGLQLGGLGSLWVQAIALSAFVLIGKPIIVIIIMGMLGYTKRTSFKTGLSMAQISEFSIIFILLGLEHQQISSSIATLIAIVSIITIAISSYTITYSDSIFGVLEKYLGLFERRKVKKESSTHHRYEAVLLGYQRGGAKFIKLFENLSKKYIVVDYDPDAISKMTEHNIPFVYGDATDVELLQEIGLEKTQLIISNITDHQTNVGLLRFLERLNPEALCICHADSVEEASVLYTLGATYVTLPHYVGSDQITSFIKKNGLKKTAFRKFREKQQAYLQAHYDEFPELESA